MIDLNKLNKSLPHGSQTEIAKKAGVHFSLVHRVLKGKSKNPVVLNAIADYLSDIKSVEERLTSLID